MPERLLLLALFALLVGCSSLAAPPADPVSPPTATTSAIASASAAPTPTPTPTSQPAPTPTPQPTLGPDGLQTIDLEVTGCPGGVALEWSPAIHPDFHHYVALRSLDPDVATAYPPIAPAVDWGDSYTTDRFVTSAVDASLIPSEAVFSYRVMAYDAEDRPLAASPVRRTKPTEVVSLGALTVEPTADGPTHLDWGLFGGLGRCFDGYRVVIGPSGGTPSTILTVVSDQSTTELDTTAFHAGETYTTRVEAVRTTTLGSFVVARTKTATYTPP